MADDASLVHFEEWAGGFLEKLQPGERIKLATDIGRAIRRNQIARIRSQQNPDGSPYEQRKKASQKKNFRGKRGAIKRRAMFTKMSTARFMKIQRTAQGIEVGFFGSIARIARVHQEGQVDTVQPSGKSYAYPSRVLLGFTQQDRDMIRDMLLQHLVK